MADQVRVPLSRKLSRIKDKCCKDEGNSILFSNKCSRACPHWQNQELILDLWEYIDYGTNRKERQFYQIVDVLLCLKIVEIKCIKLIKMILRH